MLRAEDVEVGMRVNHKDLADICYTLIILADFQGDRGVVIYVGEPNTAEVKRLYSTLDDICTIYNSDDIIDGWFTTEYKVIHRFENCYKNSVHLIKYVSRVLFMSACS